MNVQRTTRWIQAWLAALCLLPVASMAITSGPVARDHIVVELVSEVDSVQPGQAFRVGLSMQHDPKWHTYWINPGDSGLETKFVWQLPDGVQAGPIEWPWPERLPIEHLVNYGYSDHILLPVTLEVPDDWPADQALDLNLRADWLICEIECIPGDVELSLSVPVAAQGNPIQSRFAPLFADVDQRKPTPVDWPARFSTDGGQLGVQIETDQALETDQLLFFPAVNSLVEHAADAFIVEQFVDGQGLLQISQPLSPFFSRAPETLSMLLVDPANQRAFELRALPDSLETAAPDMPVVVEPLSLLWILLLALGGGMLLNLMPCVFPVLSLKAMSLVSSSDSSHAGQGVAYTLGVVLSFALLAGVLLVLRAAGEAIGWGFQLQSPWFIAALVYLFFVMGLSLSGMVEIGTRWMGVGQGLTEQQGLRGSFFTGVLATVVASPCTAPFMGTALGVAVTLPTSQSLLIFVALGFGLALPMLLLSVLPGLARWLPKPGAWMDTFKQAMAFPLYLTVVWLLWVLARQAGADALAAVLIGMVMLVFAIWLAQRPGSSGRSTGGRAALRHATVGASLIIAVFAVVAAERSIPDAAEPEDQWWQAWSPSLLAELQTDPSRGVLVNMTADWCVTCLVNERIALSSDEVRDALAARDVIYLKGDWTRRDADITAYLAQYGRNGVPLYVYYPPGEANPEPQVLPQILTPGLVIDLVEL
ncbi:MAG: protein-disulfide reductase DsbD domain-containing protein [Pseudomonadota bacterium]